MIPVSPEQIELDPIEIDPRPCQLCGLTIDQHELVDDGNGPLFFCPEMTLPELERRAELHRQEEVAAMVEQWERADPRDAWRHTGDPAPPADVRNSHIGQKRQPYCTPQSIVDAFGYVVSLKDADHLARWLADHPRDAPTLLELLEGK